MQNASASNTTSPRRVTTWLRSTRQGAHTTKQQGNENQNPDEIPPLPSRTATTTKTDDTNNGENTENLNPHTALIGVETYGITTWGKLAWETTEVKHVHTLRPSNPLLGTHSSKMKAHVHQGTHRRMCIAALFTEAPDENKP